MVAHSRRSLTTPILNDRSPNIPKRSLTTLILNDRTPNIPKQRSHTTPNFKRSHPTSPNSDRSQPPNFK
ncbi:MAG: hypothetical protein WCO29_01530 [Nostocales cyanobacterium ELA583]